MRIKSERPFAAGFGELYECMVIRSPPFTSAGHAIGRQARRVRKSNWVSSDECVDVDTSHIPERISSQPPPIRRVVIAQSAEDQPGFGVRAIAPLRAVAIGIGIWIARLFVPVSVVNVGGQDVPTAIQALGHAALRVEGVERTLVPPAAIAGCDPRILLRIESARVETYKYDILAGCVDAEDAAFVVRAVLLGIAAGLVDGLCGRVVFHTPLL